MGSLMRGPDAVCMAKILSRPTKKSVSVNETQAQTGASEELRSGKTSHSPSLSMFADGRLMLWVGPKRASGLGETFLVFIRGCGAHTNGVIW
jgi:hypothetical protein